MFQKISIEDFCQKQFVLCLSVLRFAGEILFQSKNRGFRIEGSGDGETNEHPAGTSKIRTGFHNGAL